uniref:Uncharacterized protein n=1 Tax=Castor canadensis TaxID=51338 RepID=A0A8C0WM66_CASCN
MAQAPPESLLCDKAIFLAIFSCLFSSLLFLSIFLICRYFQHGEFGEQLVRVGKEKRVSQEVNLCELEGSSISVEDLQGVTYAKLNIHKLFKVAFVPAEEPLGSYDYAPLKV